MYLKIAALNSNVAALKITEEDMTVLRNKIVDHISMSKGAFFRSQQIGEPDLTFEEKRSIVEDVLNKSLGNFLLRYGSFLLEDHLKYFELCSTQNENYEVDICLREIKKKLIEKNNHTIVKNRRLEAMKRLTNEGEYFSEEQMKQRNPLLYEQLVGKFLTEEEKEERSYFDFNKEKLSSFLLERYDKDESEKLLHKQQDFEDSVMEEEENSSEDEGDTFDNVKHNLWGERKSNPYEEVNKIEKNMFFEEFRSHMYSSFLQGQDENFDYKNVDTNNDYDDMDALDRDEEDKYFDSESPDNEIICAKSGKEEEEDPLEVYMNHVDKQS